MNHEWFRCPPTCALKFCPFCAGGLKLCSVCGGAEGTLTTECCGRRLTTDEADAVYLHRTLDFRDGEWLSTADATSKSTPT